MYSRIVTFSLGVMQKIKTNKNCIIVLQIAQLYALHMLRPAMYYSHQIIVSTAVHYLQSDLFSVWNTGNGSRRKRHCGHVVPFGLEHNSKSEPWIIVHDTSVDICCDHQIIALPNTNRRYHISGKCITCHSIISIMDKEFSL